MIKSYAPVALFVYNRPEHLKKTVEALLINAEASETELYVFSDGAKDEKSIPLVQEVRKYIKTISGFLSLKVIERQENMGLGNSIINGISSICKMHGRVIVLEDDLVCAPYFLKYMNDGLNTYESETRVASILGYALPLHMKLPETYFVRGADCYGWATWSRAWELFEEDGSKLLDELVRTQQTNTLDLNGVMGYTQMLKDQIDGKNNSWAIRWHVSMFLREMLTLTPSKSLIRNIGTDGSGTNFGLETFLDTMLFQNTINVGGIVIDEHPYSPEATELYFRRYRSLNARLMRRCKHLLNKLFC